MNGMLKNIVFKAQAVLCVLLILNVTAFWAGCGQGVLRLPDGSYRVTLDPTHPLSAKLKDTPFAGATAVDVNPAAGEFRFLFADAARQVSGTFAQTPSGPQVTQLTIQAGAEWVTLDVDVNKAISGISNSRGDRWSRPADWQVTAADAQAAGVDAYLAANRQLLELAAAVDQQNQPPGGGPENDDGSSSGPSEVKAQQAALGPVLAAGIFLAVWPGGILAAILWVVEVIFLIQLIF